MLLVYGIAEIPKTEAAFEEHLILKTFLLKSMNAFAPVFYVAFFKGRLVRLTYRHTLLQWVHLHRTEA